MPDIYGFLDDNGIAYERHDHPAVYTVAEAAEKAAIDGGVKTKNLFLRDASGKRHFLVVVPADRRVDLGSLRTRLGTSKLGFGSPDRLERCLGVEPGAVCLLAVINDTAGAVEVVIDRAVWEADAVQSHPLVNTATLVIPQAGVARLLEATGHDVRVIDVPAPPARS